jgi:hypothetical protein
MSRILRRTSLVDVTDHDARHAEFLFSWPFQIHQRPCRTALIMPGRQIDDMRMANKTPTDPDVRES